jgi:hypothetical protein
MMAARKPVTAKVPMAGSLAEPVHGSYPVQPGGPDGPEYFEPTLAGMDRAIGRAAWLSFAGPDQQVLVHRRGHAPRVIFAYSGGVCTQRPACVIAAQAPVAVRS